MSEHLIGKRVELPSLERGRVVGQLSSGEYLLEYEKGGRIIVFDEKELKGNDMQRQLLIETINDLIVDNSFSQDSETCDNINRSIERLQELLGITDDDLNENYEYRQGIQNQRKVF